MNERKEEYAKLEILLQQALESEERRAAKVGTEILETGDAHVAEQPTQRVPKPLFETGHVLINRQVLDFLSLKVIDRYLTDHVTGQWGDLSHMSDANEAALVYCGPIVSGLRVTANYSVYIITDADRSRTIIMMKNDYR